ncbi:hypothetical protein C8Q78DRAFT_1014550 [Trametes maxima]|nr:hypothetical protein C8Q78DRAFT_1014550 [Trametes maxima]
MGSYYREHVSYPNITSGPAPPYLPPLAVDDPAHNFVHAHDAHANDAQTASDDPNAKRCSVKGCAVVLPDGYPHKMCEECRGRHRIYATTKRAKRKMEKALLNNAQTGQPVVWMPDEDGSQREREAQPLESSRTFEPSSQAPPLNDENSQPFDFSQGWDPRTLDPRLFSQTSELAGALTLPHAQHHLDDHELFGQGDHERLHRPRSPEQQQQPALPPHPVLQVPQHHHQSFSRPSQSAGPPPPPPAPEIHPVLAEVLKAVPNLNLSTRVTSGPTVPVGATAPPVDGQLPPRFCSIKGCKTLIAGNSFFKMCEPCRNRYRNYGTTKRAKWRKEKEVAVQELHKIREEEDKRRAEQGLPPLPPEDDIWHEYAASPEGTVGPQPQAGPSSGSGAESQPAPRPPRMCTVSHCREILPGDYQFLRCERHRLQNRHHSKLKRVRDKEVKAQAYGDWAAVVGPSDQGAGSDFEGEGEGEDGQHGGDEGASLSPDAHARAAELPLSFSDIEHHLRDASISPEFALSHVVAESGIAAQLHGAGTTGGTDMDVDIAGQGEQRDFDETPLGAPSQGLPPAARGTRRKNHVCSIKACANLLSPSNPWKMCDLCRSRDRAGRRLKALRDSGLIPPELAEGNIERVKMEVEGKARTPAGAGEEGEKKGKKRKKKQAGGKESTAASGEAHANAEAGPSAGRSVPSGEASNGTVAPSALGHVPPQPAQDSHAESSTSVFSSLPVADQNSVVFMDPMSPEEAAGIKTRSDKPQFSSTPIPIAGQPSNTSQQGSGVNGGDASASSGAPAPKKKGKKKGKAKASTENDQHPSGSASTQTADASHSSQKDASGDTHPASPPPYLPPPNGYPFFMQGSPYMHAYPPPPNYGYPPSPSKGPYPPLPPMYPPPYGAAYPTPYGYPGQPYPYPYPPPPGQPYPPPPAGQGYPPPGQASPQPGQAGQPYPPMPPFPYPYAYPPPPPNYQAPPSRQSSPAPEGGSSQEQQHPQAQAQAQMPPLVYPHYHSPPAPSEQAPPPQPPPPAETAKSASASTSTRAPSSEPSRHPPPQPPPPSQPPSQKYSTFIVRTEETYQNENTGCTNGTKPVFSLKRKQWDGAELEAGSAYAYSKFRIDVHPATTPVSGASTPGGGYVQVMTPEVVQEAVPVSEERTPCGNAKHCKRLLPPGTTGSLCERCKERLKKKQAKAKHRFKLEPKSLLGRSASVQPGNGGTASGSPPPVVLTGGTGGRERV